nr:hypothetical protein BaRGS_030678 [Batillaria attramentaria]
MGYEKDVAQIVTALNRHAGHYRQTILLSATLTAGVERLAGIALTDHEMVDASSQPEKVNNMETADTSAQDAEFALPEKLKQNFVMADYVKELNKHKISVHEISMKDILMVLLTAIHELPQPQVPTKRQDPRTFEEAATYLQDRFEEQVFKNRNLQTLAAKG